VQGLLLRMRDGAEHVDRPREPFHTCRTKMHSDKIVYVPNKRAFFECPPLSGSFR
jgi:hypothetical protein